MCHIALLLWLFTYIMTQNVSYRNVTMVIYLHHVTYSTVTMVIYLHDTKCAIYNCFYGDLPTSWHMWHIALLLWWITYRYIMTQNVSYIIVSMVIYQHNDMCHVELLLWWFTNIMTHLSYITVTMVIYQHNDTFVIYNCYYGDLPTSWHVVYHVEQLLSYGNLPSIMTRSVSLRIVTVVTYLSSWHVGLLLW
jgi:hypothetical protein